jgi:hypothetical protein
MNVEKTENGFRLFSEGGEILMNRESFEDLYYAVPTNTTAFYRLLTEQVPKSDEERERIVAMIQALPDMDANLGALQERIQEIQLD